MICKFCGGRVEWQGPLSALTHTKCLDCQATNAQRQGDPEDSFEILEPFGAGDYVKPTCRVCNKGAEVAPLDDTEEGFIHESCYPAQKSDAEPHTCFVCGKGAEVEGLVGSGHADDFCHLKCLTVDPFAYADVPQAVS
jgi:hypothetical protein